MSQVVRKSVKVDWDSFYGSTAPKLVRKSAKLVGFDYHSRFREFEGFIKKAAYSAYVKIQQVSMVDLDDLINDGHIYMLQVSEKYDRTRGTKFSTFMTEALNRYYINTVKYHFRECRKGNMNTYDIDTFIPSVEKDYDLVYEIKDDETDEETRYNALITKYLQYVEEKDREVYLLMSSGKERSYIMEELNMKPWVYNNARVRIQNAIRRAMMENEEDAK